MRDFLLFNGTPSTDFGVYVASANQLDAPKRSEEALTVPGRNGTLTYDNGCFEDVEVDYTFYVPGRVVDNVRDFRNFLLSQAGKKRIEDTLHPEEYREGKPTEGLSMESFDRVNGTFTFGFTCSPQRFLKSGERTKTFTASGSIYNPTKMEARPLIRVYGSGELTIGDKLVTIASNNYDYIDIDCMIRDCYCKTANANSSVTVSTDYPVLDPGENGIAIGTGITKVEIIPRWWQL